MKRHFGTVARGLRSPIINEGDDLQAILLQLIKSCAYEKALEPRDRDILCITESILARAQGNYATIYEIRDDLQAKLPTGTKRLGLVFPILSRNRFSILLKAIALAVEEVVLLLSYPQDEVGNALFNPAQIVDTNLNPWHDVLDLETYEKNFGQSLHPITGINYIKLYQEIIEAAGATATIIFANRPEEILPYTPDVLCCDIHTRGVSREKLARAGARTLLDLSDLLNTASGEHGYNIEYGLLGSNKADEERVKLFPHSCQEFVETLAVRLKEEFSKDIEVMIYGDGAFKDPVAKIWELADPVVSPGFTRGLHGHANEVKIKFLADSMFATFDSKIQEAKIREFIRNKDSDLTGNMSSEGTTPRHYTDLLGTLADLISGSGDKGTPFVYIQGYFDNYADC